MKGKGSQVFSIVRTIQLAVYLRESEDPNEVIKEIASRLLKSGEYTHTGDLNALLVLKFENEPKLIFELIRRLN